MVHLSNIVIGYDIPLFSIEHITLDKGQLVALIGSNGSGKTTFLNTLTGTQAPIKGEVHIGGKSLQKISVKEKVKLVSYVASKFDGVPHLTVFDLIAMGRAPYTNLLHKLNEQDKRLVADIIANLGLSEIQHQVTTAISDGERQLAMIGKAIAQETSIIVLDEPTAFLDYSNRIKIVRLLKELAEKYQKLILLSTHDLEIALSNSSLILALTKENKTMKVYPSGIAKATIVREVFGLG